MLYFDNYVECNINNDGVYKIVTPCFVKIEVSPSQTEQTGGPPSQG